jgi:hypothetical protein
MPTRYPTAVLAVLTVAEEPGELRLRIETNAGRVLEEWAVYADSLATAGDQLEELLTRAELRFAPFRGNSRHGWRSTVQAQTIDPDAAQD